MPEEGAVITEQNSLEKGRSGGIYQTNSERYVMTILLVFKNVGWLVLCKLQLRSTSDSKQLSPVKIVWGYIDYFIESATYGFLFTSCKTLENERLSAANE